MIQVKYFARNRLLEAGAALAFAATFLSSSGHAQTTTPTVVDGPATSPDVQPATGTAQPPATGAPGTAATSTQAAASSGNAIGDIVVTANRRAESVQRSSLAVAAFTGEQVTKAGVAQATDLTKLTQGLQVALIGSTSQIYVRGVGDASSNPLANPGVAFNVDGVYVGRPEGVGVNFFDIERIEVLKGPQGTLYGRNTSGGAINLITRSPNLDKLGGTLNVEAGNFGLFRVDGAVNVPLTDTLAVRVAANRVNRDGYLTDGTSDDDQLGGRLKLLFKPTTDVSLVISVDGERVRGRAGGYVYRPQRPGSSAWEGTTSPAANAYVASAFNPNIVAGKNDTFVHNDFWAISGQLDWNLGFATLTVIPAYRHSDTDTLTYNAQSQHLLGRSNQETLEARLSHASSSFKWVAGGFFFHESNPGEIRIFVGPGLLQSNPQYQPRGTSYSAFGEATYSVTDRLRLIAGGRYTSENRKLNGDFFISPKQDGNYIDVEKFNGDKTFNSVTWKAGAEFDLAARNMLYFTASTGFKSGGITQTIPPNNIYQPEKVLAFELGSRNRFLDNRLQVNLEGFHWTYTDQQNSHLTFDTLGNVNFLTQNAGQATLYGFNVDVVARPTNADTLHVGVEYDHSKYSKDSYQVPIFAYSPLGTGCKLAGVAPGPFVPLATIDCSGFELPHAPAWSGQADYTHTFTFASAAALDLDFAARFASATWLSFDFNPPERAPSFTILSAAATFRPSSRVWSLTGYVRNIANGKEYVGGQQQPQAPPLFAAVITPPRTFGAQLRINF